MDTAVAVGFGVDDGLGVADGLGVEVGLAVDDGLGVEEGIGVDDGLGVEVGIGVDDGTGVDVAVGVNVSVGIDVAVEVGVAVAVGIAWTETNPSTVSPAIAWPVVAEPKLVLSEMNTMAASRAAPVGAQTALNSRVISGDTVGIVPLNKKSARLIRLLIIAAGASRLIPAGRSDPKVIASGIPSLSLSVLSKARQLSSNSMAKIIEFTSLLPPVSK